MATTDKKQDARKKREAAQKAAEAKAKRNKQLQILAGVIFAALIVVVLVVVIAGGDKGSKGGDAENITGADQTAQLLDGIPQNGLTLGQKDAPVQIVEFIDLQCPHCQNHQLDVQPKVINELVKSGEAKLTLAPIAFLGPDSEDGRVVLARLAGQDKAWNFANLWYLNAGTEGSGYATDEWIGGLLKAIPSDNPAEDGEREADPETQKTLDEVDRWQEKLRVSSTPTFFVGKTGTDVTDFEEVEASDKVAEDLATKVREIQGQE